LVYNHLYNANEHFIDPVQFGTQKIRSNTMLGLREGPGAGPTLILNSSDLKEWTMFIDMSSDCPSNREKARVLVSNKGTLDSSAGFILGLNGSNNLFYEYVDEDGTSQIKTFYKPIGESALMGVSKSKEANSVVLSIFDPVYNRIFSQNFNVKESGTAVLLCIGGIAGEDLSSNTQYEESLNNMNNFIFISKSMTSGEMNTFSDSFFLTAYEGGRIEDVLTTFSKPGRSVQIKVKDGVKLDGYVYQPRQVTPAGTTTEITIYDNMPVYKPKYKTVTQYKKGEGTVSKKVPTIIPESKTYDQGHLKTYSEKCLLLNADADPSKVVEIYSFDELQTNINRVASFGVADNTFKIDELYAGEININIYLNGKIQEKDIDYQVTNGTTIKKMQGAYSELDKMTYDISSSASIGIDFAGYQGTIYFYGYNDKDVYLDGEKLVLEQDYENAYGDMFLAVYADSLPVGRMVFVDRNQNVTNTNYSSEKYVYCQNFNIISEKVWIGGVRSSENSEYSLTCTCDLNNSDNIAESKQLLIYNNEGTFFNIY